MSRAVSSEVLVGRELELEALGATLTDALQSRPSLTLLTGEAGVGKTRVARDVVRRALGLGMIAVHGECVELSGGEVPYGPLGAAIRELDPDVLAVAVAKLPIIARRQLARAFPGVPFGVDGIERHEDELTQAQLFGWLLLLIGQVAASVPVLLTIEDVHWADVSTRDFLLFLCQQMRSERVAVVVTLRSSELHREHPVRPFIAKLTGSDRVRHLELAPMSRDEVERQVEGILGATPAPELMNRLLERGEGIPLYTEELLAGGADGDVELPSTVSDALLLRVQRLSPFAQEMMRLLAAMIGGAGDELIEAASGLSRSALSEALREGVDRYVLVCDRRTGDYRFRHALLREAVYGDLLPSERVDLHRRTATALEKRDPRANAAERAYHWEAANEPGPAAAAAIDAALAAERAYAHGEALSQFERALKLWADGLPELAEAGLDRVDILIHAADEARWLGEYDHAVSLCTKALDLFDHEADPLRAADLFARVGRNQPWNLSRWLDANNSALRLLPESEVLRRMRLQADTALGLTFDGRWDEARATAEAALGEAFGPETQAEESAARAALGLAMAFSGELERGEEQLIEAVALADRAGSIRDVVQVRLDYAEVVRLRGSIAEALEIMLEAETVAGRYGMTGAYAVFSGANAADDLLRLGSWDDVDKRIDRLVGQLSQALYGRLLTLSVAGRLYTARGEFEAAAQAFERAISSVRGMLMEFVPAIYSGYAELHLWCGRVDAACECIASAVEHVEWGREPLHAPNLFSMGARAEAERAELARSLGDAEEVQRARESARRLHDRLLEVPVTGWRGDRPPELQAHLASCRAELSRADGTSDPALWAEAVTHWRGREAPYTVAYALYRQAEALLASGGSRSDAQPLLIEADSICAALGARPLRAEIVALARRGRLKLTAEAHAKADASTGGDPAHSEDLRAGELGLTAREAEVLALLAAGLTNREISERLYISRHTAGVHVSHILAKLGVPNRVMAAAAARRLGLAADPTLEA